MIKSIFFRNIVCFILLFAAYNNSEKLYAQKSDSLRIGEEAPPFVMRNLFTGEAVFSRDFAGKTLREPWKKKERQVIVLSFWATWCQPCKTEIPILTNLSAEFQDQPAKFFLVNTMERSDQTEDSIKAVYRNREYSLPCLTDPGLRFAGLYSVKALPVLVVIDKMGIVRKINRGYHENFQIELGEMIKQLVQEKETTTK